MRVLCTVAALLVGMAAALDVVEMHRLVQEHWGYQVTKNHTAFTGSLAPDAKFFLNGAPDDTPWTDAGFVKDLYTKVTYTDIQPVAPMALSGPNELMTMITWGITNARTFETFDLGVWHQKYTFNDNGMIQEVASVCNEAPLLAAFADLGAARASFAPREQLQKLLRAYSANSVEGVVSLFVDSAPVLFLRNGIEDVGAWWNGQFLQMLFANSHVSAELVGFAETHPRAAYAHIAWTFTGSSIEEPIELMDAWYITFAPGGRISQVQSTADVAVLASFYQAIGLDKVIAKNAQKMRKEFESQQKREERRLRKLQQTDGEHVEL